MVNTCLCGNEELFEKCCSPFILGSKQPVTAEQLMRSRYSAYASKAYGYIVQTYDEKTRAELSVNDIAQSTEDSLWVKLEVVNTFNTAEAAFVEFKAYYQQGKQFFLMHEVSRFIQENNLWRYVDGEMQRGSGIVKLNRNDNCLCQSGKKYKKCCG